MDDHLKACIKAISVLWSNWKKLQANFHKFLRTDPVGSAMITSAFDLSKPAIHLEAFKKLKPSFKDFDEDSLQRTMDLWANKVKTWLQNPEIRQKNEQAALIRGGQILSGILLANGDYYKSLKVMIDMIKMGENSPNISLAALTLALDLEELSIFEKIRTIVHMENITEDFESWLNSLDLNLQVRKCKASNEMDLICDKVYEKLASLVQEKVKTYAMTYTEMMLRSALMYAFKQPNANVKKIGDSLYHQHRAYTGLYDLFSDAVVSNGEMRMFSDKKPTLVFDKCFLFSQYCNSSKRYIHEFFDCGMVANVELECLAYFKFSLFSCLPYRLLNAVNCFYLIGLLMEFKVEKLSRIKDWITELCSIKYDWVLHQEKVYSRAIINELPKEHCKKLFKLQKKIFVEKFAYNEVAKQLGMQVLKKIRPLPIQLAENFMRATTYLLTNSQHGKEMTAKKRKRLISYILESCKRAETSCRSNWLMLRQLGRLVMPQPQTSWLIPESSEDIEIPADEEVKKAIMDAYSEYKSFQHLLYIFWRRNCATYIAANVEQALQDCRPYEVAMFLSESMSIDLRSATRMKENERFEAQKFIFALKKDDTSKNQSQASKNSKEAIKKCGKKNDNSKNQSQASKNAKNAKKAVEKSFENSVKESFNENFPVFPTGYSDESQSFKTFIEGFPSSVTVLQFSLDSNEVLWLVRYNNSHEPYTIPLCHIAKGDAKNALFDRLKKILEESEATFRAKNIALKDFREKFKRLDNEMEELLSEMQEHFFGSLWPLFQAFASKATESSKARRVQSKIESAGFCPAAAIILTQLLDHISNDKWNELINLMAERERSIKKELLSELKFSNLKIQIGPKEKRCEEESYVFLVLPLSLSTIPWESMTVFRNSLVSRIPSIFTLNALLVKHAEVPKSVNIRNSYYVLDPSNEFPATKKILGPVIKNMKWQGVTGEIPKKGEIMKELTSQDMYLFFGHGSGRKYIGRSREFKNLDCRSVCLLMGCSSVNVTDEARNFGNQSVVYDLMLSNCPCIVGFLWTISSAEADLFFLKLMGCCIEDLKVGKQKKKGKPSANSIKDCSSTPVKPKSKIKSDASHSILKELPEARAACEFPYLTGAAAVSYGLPVIWKY